MIRREIGTPSRWMAADTVLTQGSAGSSRIAARCSLTRRRRPGVLSPPVRITILAGTNWLPERSPAVALRMLIGMWMRISSQLESLLSW